MLRRRPAAIGSAAEHSPASVQEASDLGFPPQPPFVCAPSVAWKVRVRCHHDETTSIKKFASMMQCSVTAACRFSTLAAHQVSPARANRRPLVPKVGARRRAEPTSLITWAIRLCGKSSSASLPALDAHRRSTAPAPTRRVGKPRSRTALGERRAHSRWLHLGLAPVATWIARTPLLSPSTTSSRLKARWSSFWPRNRGSTSQKRAASRMLELLEGFES